MKKKHPRGPHSIPPRSVRTTTRIDNAQDLLRELARIKRMIEEQTTPAEPTETDKERIEAAEAKRIRRRQRNQAALANELYREMSRAAGIE